jgi:pilus assembly protein CpaB
MSKVGIVIAIFLALLSGAGASVLAYNYLKNQPSEIALQLEPVVVASQDLTFGETLESENMAVVMYPEGSVPSGSYRALDSLEGQVTKVFLKKNEPILDSKLSSKGGGLSLLIDDDMRASSIQVDKVSGVSGFILPGDKVDVILTVDRHGKKADAVAKTILQNVDVLAAGEKTEQKGDKVITVQAVTLLVTPEGAQSLALATQEGKLHLALRNPSDNEIHAVDQISKSGILAEKKKEAPKVRTVYVTKEPEKKEEPPPKPDSLVIIRGSAKKTEAPAMTEETKENADTKP